MGSGCTIHLLVLEKGEGEASLVPVKPNKNEVERNFESLGRKQGRKRIDCKVSGKMEVREGVSLECFLENLIEIPFIFTSANPSSTNSTEVILYPSLSHFPLPLLHLGCGSMIIYSMYLKDER